MDMVDKAQPTVERAEVEAVEAVLAERPNFEARLLMVLGSNYESIRTLAENVATLASEVKRMHERLDEMEAQASQMMDPKRMADLFGGMRG